ncbi:MAG: hypothetical protein V4661_12960 [Pseudomonadota bacterium]|jgi:hypothetical protein
MRIIVVVAAGLGLTGCSSISMPSMDMFKSKPQSVTVQLESLPVGAEARTSSGQSCQTPCSMSVPAENNFTVTFSLPKYQSETVPVQVVRQGADTDIPDAQGSGAGILIDPNPVYAELQPAVPGRGGKAAPKTPPRPKKPAAAAPAPAASSPFPPPPGR